MRVRRSSSSQLISRLSFDDPGAGGNCAMMRWSKCLKVLSFSSGLTRQSSPCVIIGAGSQEPRMTSSRSKRKLRVTAWKVWSLQRPGASAFFCGGPQTS